MNTCKSQTQAQSERTQLVEVIIILLFFSVIFVLNIINKYCLKTEQVPRDQRIDEIFNRRNVVPIPNHSISMNQSALPPPETTINELQPQESEYSYYSETDDGCPSEDIENQRYNPEFFIHRTMLPVDKFFPALMYKDIKSKLISIKTMKFLNKECAICLGSIENEHHCRMLSCFHIFHQKCVLDWLIQNPSCPLCKKQFDSVEDVQIDWNKQELKTIEVDFDCFYSDHIYHRTSNFLTQEENRLAIFYANKNEFRNMVYSYDIPQHICDQDEVQEIIKKGKIKLQSRLRSRSSDGEYQYQKKKNKEDKFGRGLYENSDWDQDSQFRGYKRIIGLSSPRTPSVGSRRSSLQKVDMCIMELQPKLRQQTVDFPKTPPRLSKAGILAELTPNSDLQIKKSICKSKKKIKSKNKQKEGN